MEGIASDIRHSLGYEYLRVAAATVVFDSHLPSAIGQLKSCLNLGVYMLELLPKFTDEELH